MDRDTFQRLLMESTYGPTIPSRFGAYAVLRDFGDTLPESDQKASTTPAPAEVALHEALWVMSHAIDVLSIQRRTDDNYILLQNLLAWRERIADYIAPPGAVEAIPSEPQPQQDLKTLLKDWVKETNTRLWDTDNTASYAGQGNGDIAAQMMWALQKSLNDLGDLLDGVQ